MVRSDYRSEDSIIRRVLPLRQDNPNHERNTYEVD